MKNKYTLYGVLAVLIWGISVAFTRTLGESLGLFTSAFVVNTLGGIISLINNKLIKKEKTTIKDLPSKYIMVCGLLFFLYNFASYNSTILAGNYQQVMVISIIKFLWPIITSILTIPILKQQASKTIVLSTLLSFIGVVIVAVGDGFEKFKITGQDFSIINLIPILLALISALSWAFYTVLTRKYLANINAAIDGTGYFMIITGLIMGIFSLLRQETSIVNPRVIAEAFFQIVVTTFGATTLWTLGIRYGKLNVVVTASNLLPVIVTITNSVILKVPITLNVIVGSVLLGIGTMWTNRTFTKKAKA